MRVSTVTPVLGCVIENGNDRLASVDTQNVSNMRLCDVVTTSDPVKIVGADVDRGRLFGGPTSGCELRTLSGVVS